MKIRMNPFTHGLELYMCHERRNRFTLAASVINFEVIPTAISEK